MSGSVRDETVIDMLKADLARTGLLYADEMSAREELAKYAITGDKSLEKCFEIFSLLHRLLNNKENLARVTREVLHDFSVENCCYLELRSTPRNVFDSDGKLVFSKREYIQTILTEIEQFNGDMIARLILSIDRSRSLEDAVETISLCNELNHDCIVGIDFSGNPSVSTLKEFDSIFDLARESNLKVTVHLAELWTDTDIEYVIKTVKPERLGHAVCLTDAVKTYLIHHHQIPIEICPTSNLKTKAVASINEHPFIEFYSSNKQYPLAICTDDCGIFNTSLAREQFIICEAFNLSLKEMLDLNRRATDCIFDKS